MSQSKTDEPTQEDVADALFETLAALTDLRERLAGGAVRSGIPPAQVVDEVWDAYELDGAAEILAQTGHERDGLASPEEWAVDELVAIDETGPQNDA